MTAGDIFGAPILGGNMTIEFDELDEQLLTASCIGVFRREGRTRRDFAATVDADSRTVDAGSSP
jgi:hypothetical protein